MISVSRRATAHLIGNTLLLSLPAFLNGYPLVFPDTGVYLAQGLAFEGHASRPPYYGLLLLPFHFGLSLWPVVFAQSLLTAILLRLILRCIDRPPSLKQESWIVAGLALLTSLSWHTSQILPDIFTSLLILCIFLLVFGLTKLSKGEYSIIAVCLLISTMVHYSHLPMLLAVGSGALILHWFFHRDFSALRTPALTLVSITILVVCAFMAYSYAYAGRATMSLDSSRFLLARLIDDGTALRLLREQCPTRNWTLCDHLDKIKGNHDTFLWNSNSPWGYIEKTKGFLGARDEANEIIWTTLTTYPGEQFKQSMLNIFTQATSFGTADTLCPCLDESKIHRIVAKYFNFELGLYEHSLQNQDRLPVSVLRSIHTPIAYLALLGCMAFVLFAFIAPKNYRVKHRLLLELLGVVILGFLCNALITGTLSGAADRYQSRVVWLPVLVIMIALLCHAPSRLLKN